MPRPGRGTNRVTFTASGSARHGDGEGTAVAGFGANGGAEADAGAPAAFYVVASRPGTQSASALRWGVTVQVVPAVSVRTTISPCTGVQ